jgi:hypothetical protein
MGGRAFATWQTVNGRGEDISRTKQCAMPTDFARSSSERERTEPRARRSPRFAMKIPTFRAGTKRKPRQAMGVIKGNRRTMGSMRLVSQTGDAVSAAASPTVYVHPL